VTAGVEAVGAMLGGEVIGVEGEHVSTADVTHARRAAASGRSKAAPTATGQTPPRAPRRSAGREAVAAERERIARGANTPEEN